MFVLQKIDCQKETKQKTKMCSWADKAKTRLYPSKPQGKSKINSI